MGKPFFYRINAADLLADAVEIEDDAERGRWIVRLAMDLVRADSAKAKSSTARAMISETEEFRKKKAEAGKKGGFAKAKAGSAIAKAGSAIANGRQKLASSSSSTETETETDQHLNHGGGDFLSIREIHTLCCNNLQDWNIGAKLTTGQREGMAPLTRIERDTVEAAFKAAAKQGNVKSLAWIEKACQRENKQVAEVGILRGDELLAYVNSIGEK